MSNEFNCKHKTLPNDDERCYTYSCWFRLLAYNCPPPPFYLNSLKNITVASVIKLIVVIPYLYSCPSIVVCTSTYTHAFVLSLYYSGHFDHHHIYTSARLNTLA